MANRPVKVRVLPSQQKVKKHYRLNSVVLFLFEANFADSVCKIGQLSQSPSSTWLKVAKKKNKSPEEGSHIGLLLLIPK